MHYKLLNKISWCPYRLTQKERKKWEEEKVLPNYRMPPIKYKRKFFKNHHLVTT